MILRTVTMALATLITLIAISTVMIVVRSLVATLIFNL